MNPKAEIVSVARGYYAMPILMALAKHGLISDLLESGVVLQQVVGNKKNLGTVLTYLQNLGWIDEENGTYKATKLGSSVLRRCGAFGILYSYRPYMTNLDGILFDENARVNVHRDENVVGSGEAHIRKYFSRIESIIKNTKARYILDVGCGDGTFLSFCKRTNPALELIGVDYNERALEVTKEKMQHPAVLFQGNVSEPEYTIEKLERHGIDPKDVLVSVWFIFHEVLGFEGIDLTKVLEGYRQLAPEHGLIIGEIFDVPHAVLAAHHDVTAIPEFNLFHDLSGQKLFERAAWQKHIRAAGFTEQFWLGLDALELDGETHFGSGIWHLN